MHPRSPRRLSERKRRFSRAVAALAVALVVGVAPVLAAQPAQAAEQLPAPTFTVSNVQAYSDVELTVTLPGDPTRVGTRAVSTLAVDGKDGLVVFRKPVALQAAAQTITMQLPAHFVDRQSVRITVYLADPKFHLPISASTQQTLAPSPLGFTTTFSISLGTAADGSPIRPEVVDGKQIIPALSNVTLTATVTPATTTATDVPWDVMTGRFAGFGFFSWGEGSNLGTSALTPAADKQSATATLTRAWSMADAGLMKLSFKGSSTNDLLFDTNSDPLFTDIGSSPRTVPVAASVAAPAPIVGTTTTITAHLPDEKTTYACGGTISVLRGTTQLASQVLAAPACTGGPTDFTVAAPENGGVPETGVERLRVVFTPPQSTFGLLVGSETTVDIDWRARPTTTTLEVSPTPADATTVLTLDARVVLGAGTAEPNAAVADAPVTVSITSASGVNAGSFALTTSATGEATTTLRPLLPGSYTARASTAAPNSYTLGSSDHANFTVDRVPTSLELAAPSSLPFGTDATVTARPGIADADPLGEGPTGSVEFAVDGVLVAVEPIIDGVATATLSELALGTRALSATYVGDQRFGVSDASGSLNVEHLPTTLTLAVADPELHPGQSTEVVATWCAPDLGGAVLTGEATFQINDATIAEAVPGEDDGTGGSCLAFVTTVTADQLGAFASSVSVDAGDPFEDATASLLDAFIVTAWPTMTYGTLSAATVTQNGAAFLTASVVAQDQPFLAQRFASTSDPRDVPVPEGTLTLTVNGAPIGEPVVVDDGEASLPIPTTTVGTSTIGAIFTPATDAYATSSTEGLPLTVKASETAEPNPEPVDPEAPVTPTPVDPPAPARPAAPPIAALPATGNDTSLATTALLSALLLATGIVLTRARRRAH